jgi:hypothetical protein
MGRARRKSSARGVFIVIDALPSRHRGRLRDIYEYERAKMVFDEETP